MVVVGRSDGQIGRWGDSGVRVAARANRRGAVGRGEERGRRVEGRDIGNVTAGLVLTREQLHGREHPEDHRMTTGRIVSLQCVVQHGSRRALEPVALHRRAAEDALFDDELGDVELRAVAQQREEWPWVSRSPDWSVDGTKPA